ncbi:MAG: hypothetical protein ACRETL_00225 [Gammaproteobacteria bacterium]
MRRLKTEVEGDIEVAGPDLAGSLTDLGLVDEYRLYFRTFVHSARGSGSSWSRQVHEAPSGHVTGA